MIVHHSSVNKTINRRRKKGFGLVNKLITKLPFEFHIPGYNYCGPGTKLEKRIARGDIGINPLDAACKQHDIAYSQSEDLLKRHASDKLLGDQAWNRVKAKDSSLGEKVAALTVAAIMKGKRKLGMGIKKKKEKKGGKLNMKKKRIIRTPEKIGGLLPLLLPILGALGALGGGAAGIAKAVNDAKASKQQLEEMHRHNIAMEDVSKGKGLFIKPYKGKGLFIKPYKGGKLGIKKKTKRLT